MKVDEILMQEIRNHFVNYSNDINEVEADEENQIKLRIRYKVRYTSKKLVDVIKYLEEKLKANFKGIDGNTPDVDYCDLTFVKR